MVEKVIDLSDIELVGFLGIKNKNIQEVETAFPKTKIVSRGNKISIKGNKFDATNLANLLGETNGIT